MKHPFNILPYNPYWKTLFQLEKQALVEILGDALCAIHHIGSTAIIHTSAKPEIDILVVVKDDSILPKLNHQIEQLGYRVRGECLDSGGTPGRFYYSKDQENRRTHKMHICQKGHPEIMAKLLFVKYLNEHESEARAYAELKRHLSEKYNYGRQIEKYLEGKTAFVLDTLEKANKKYREIKYEHFCQQTETPQG